MSKALLSATDAQLQRFREVSAQRATRAAPEFMLIDDQRFAIQLMQAALSQSYTLYTALRAREGFALYLEHAPDILWLDIDMPEINGHQLAESLNAIDPSAYIVMVTASEYTEEGAQANRNHVKGFVTKPYSKKKIRDCVDKFMLLHPERKNGFASPPPIVTPPAPVTS